MSLLKLALLVSVRFYRLLLFMYPKNFRAEYGDEIVMLFSDMSKDAIRQRGWLGLFSVWSVVLPELGATVREQHLLALSYYQVKRIKTGLLQAIISLIILVLSFLYLLHTQ
ncbi:hypothetical protein NUACC21_63300 [Scytonema sp. NUACC21]